MVSNGWRCMSRGSRASTISTSTARPATGRITYGQVFKRAEREFSEFNFEAADTARLFEHFGDAEAECQALIGRGIALPAYDQCLKASHLFNLLDARGVISVTERAAYIGRVRALARACCETWLAGSAAMSDARP